jgi:DNA-binding CsgD family transcriptional regulator
MHFVGFQPEDRAKARPGGVAQMFLHFGPPVMQCTVAECRVLDLATAGLSDPEIAAELGISANTVKALWRSVLARGSRALDLTGGRPEPDPVRPVRGAELRSHILLHLRDNPQDMRPFRLR